MAEISFVNFCMEFMDPSKLKLNPDKTEFTVFGSKVLINQFSHFFPVNILGNLLFPSDKV